MAVEKTFIMVKPGGVERGLTGEVLRRIEGRGFKISGAKLLKVSKAMAKAHYDEHKARPFFGELVDVITRSPVFAMVVEGESAIKVMRTMIGATNPADAAPGSIRGDFALEMSENIVHGSDSVASAKREIAIYFERSELVKPA